MIILFINCIILAVSSSIDSFGIGITYGIKNTKISVFSKFILFFISIFVALISVSFGNWLSNILPKNFTNILGCLFLLFIGFSIIIKALFEYNSSNNNYFDFNHSNLIDPKEAIVLGLALSLDSFGIGVSSSLINFSSFLFPFCVSVFQFAFLSLGIWFGSKVNKLDFIPDFIWSFISAFLLICIALFRFCLDYVI